MTNALEQIDFLAAKYHETGDVKYFEQFLKLLSPFIHKTINKACTNSSWDKQELYSIISADMWRLINRQAPVAGMPYHWLCLRQIKNKLINYITTTAREKSFKVCPECSKTYPHSVYKCEECAVALTTVSRETHDILDNAETYENIHSYTPDYLEDMVQRDLVTKLLEQVIDPTTRTILQMLMEGASYAEISDAVGIAHNAVRRRIKKCQPIVSQLIKENA